MGKFFGPPPEWRRPVRIPSPHPSPFLFYQGRSGPRPRRHSPCRRERLGHCQNPAHLHREPGQRSPQPPRLASHRRLGLLDGFCCRRLDLHGFEQHLSLAQTAAKTPARRALSCLGLAPLRPVLLWPSVDVKKSDLAFSHLSRAVSQCRRWRWGRSYSLNIWEASSTEVLRTSLE